MVNEIGRDVRALCERASLERRKGRDEVSLSSCVEGEDPRLHIGEICTAKVAGMQGSRKGQGKVGLNKVPSAPPSNLSSSLVRALDELDVAFKATRDEYACTSTSRNL